jgi:hypothetical protein
MVEGVHQMKLENTIEVWGHTFTMNVAIQDGLNWNGSAPVYKHFCSIELGDDEVVARAKAHTIAIKFGDLYKCTLQAHPKVATRSYELNAQEQL